MSHEKNQNEELSLLESELASLVPRRDRLDPRWRAFLAKAADLNAVPDESTGRSACAAPGDHFFLCAYCGTSGPVASRRLRWAWPAAFSAMTAVAAALLVLVIVQPEIYLAGKGGNRSLPGEKSTTTSPQIPPSLPRQPVWETDLALASSSGPRWRQERLFRLAATDFQLFDEVLTAEFSRQWPGDLVAANGRATAKAPLSAHEFMRQMLDDSGQ